ncbi:hypothetical protein Q428_05735 [Fervidicella metallireducens AeB]|uniref:Uncharacterized protein n=1 Tax=Fervidicella metallireducens AeB TaxID=1403537 RepID=A0A017RWU0_9CLOT|nr:PAS domain-containing protein [Fervidicella metallireducens]EYE88874.1 hypothetical protein Q428_05735 [Fervidicella metallireducens AeB]
MKDDELLKSYIPIAEFIGEAMGSDCEVALYDARNRENSLIYIKNNSVSGREVGSPLTKLCIKMIEDNLHIDNNFITKYPGKTKDGKLLRSSTLFIKNASKEVIGFLTINLNISELRDAANYLNKFLREISGGPERNLEEEKAPLSEDFSVPIEDYAMSVIQNTLKEVPVPPERMSVEEKIEMVKKLNDKGVFLLKGAVNEVAKQLRVSENTIYRYINKRD